MKSKIIILVILLVLIVGGSLWLGDFNSKRPKTQKLLNDSLVTTGEVTKVTETEIYFRSAKLVTGSEQPKTEPLERVARLTASTAIIQYNPETKHFEIRSKIGIREGTRISVTYTGIADQTEINAESIRILTDADSIKIEDFKPDK